MALHRSTGDTGAVCDALKSSVESQLQAVIANKDVSEYTFLSAFTAPERSYVHSLARSLKLMSKSRGKCSNRQVTVYKRERSSIIHRDATFHLTQHSHKVITSLMTQAPLTTKEKLDITPHTERDRSTAPDVIQREPNRSVNRLVTGVPIVPTSRRSDSAHQRQLLPIYALKESIIQTINDNPVVVISGETGSGKTTQVPQYIMEYHERMGRACRIICSQPRRIAAVAMGERVAIERSCKVGTEVGYQIRHESVTNSRTILTYITNGILLRTLMCGDSSLATVTHLIMDEIHIRDRVADFILVAVREALAKYRSLRLVLISASVDTASFSKYFNNCPVITVPGRLFEVKEYFLEDILKLTDYKTKEMVKYRNESKKRSQQDQEAKEWMVQAKENKTGQSPLSTSQGKSKSQDKGVDHYLENAIRLGCEESLKQVLHLIQNNEASVDHQHPSTRITPLMAACIHGHLEIAEDLLNLGASLHLAVNKNQTAYDFARDFGHQSIMDLLTLYKSMNFAKGTIHNHKSSSMADDKYILLESYKHCFKDNVVNADLILAIINKIQSSNQIGAVLIFLPGYEDIVMMLDKLSKREQKPNENLLKLVALHSKMDTCDQKIVFHPAPKDMRKIILSTNIAESCITLQDVVFVIDSGLVRESSMPPQSHVQTVRCSQSCVRQRRARAGRTQPGVCYHLFSSADYYAMPTYRTPEILRTPLQNLCLQTKLLAQGNIADFIAKALDPPSFGVVRDAVLLLKAIDALDPCEEVTLLGQHLIDLPLPPHLGKALIYGVLLKCLDPILTIVAMLSYDDPFLTPDQPAQRREVQVSRRRFAAESQSDHCALLVVFMKWLAARNQGNGRAFCHQHHLCEARLEMVHSHRAQLLTQLRSSGFVRAKDMGSDIRDLNQNSEKLSVVKAALTGGHYPNLVRVDREMNGLKTQKQVKVTFHPSSVLRGGGLQRNIPATLATDWIIYEELSSAGNTCNVRVCSLVTDVTVAIFAGPSRFPIENFTDPEAVDRGSDSDEQEVFDERTATLKVDEWAVFRVQPHIARLIIMLRNKWHAVLAKRLRTPYKPLLPNDEAVIEAVVAVLSSEEEEVGLVQPSGIGAKPLLINNQENDHSPLRRRSYNDITKQLATVDISGNRHPNHRRNYDMNDNASNGGAGTSSSNSNSSSLSPCLSQGSSSQHEPAGKRTFFIIRHGSARSFERACNTNIWNFQSTTEMRLKNAYREGKTVILIISLHGSSHFQGYARLKSDHFEWNDVIYDQSAHSSPSMGSAEGMPLPIEWLKMGNIKANSLRHFGGIDFSRLMTCRDGQEIDSNIGEALCLLWESQVPHNPPPPHHVFHHGNGHGRAIRAPQQQYYGNNSYGPPHAGNSVNMRQNM